MSDKRKSKNEVYFWVDAIDATCRQLDDHCRESKRDQLRFQNGRLFANLSKQIEAAAAEDRRSDPIDLMYYAYREMTWSFPPSCDYKEPLRLHCEELKARGQNLDSFCDSFRELLAKNWQATGNELLFRVKSLASWIEAQESFTQWLAFKAVPVVWRGNPDERRHAYQASILANLIQHPGDYEYMDESGLKRVHPWEGSGIGTNEKGVRWSPQQWANILHQAARLAEKKNSYTPLEAWVWWCYPVFSRYGWNTHEVYETARLRNFADKDSLAVIEKPEQLFRRQWIWRGLRFSWAKKTNRKTPPLAEFVKHLAVPKS